MSVRRRGARSLVFVRGQKLAQLVCCRLPFPRRIRAKRIRHCAPSRVADENGFFRFGRVAVIRFDQFEGADGFDVGVGFFPAAAFADVVACDYPEVAGGGFFLFGFESVDNRRGRSPLDGNAHSRIVSSHAAW